MTKRILARSAHLDIPTEPERPAAPERTAKTLARVLAGACAGCDASGMDRELFSVPDGHLTFFGGDELCRPCALDHGVL